MPHLILENKNLILFLNLKFNFMKQRRFMFKLQSNKAVTLALGLMLGLCPVSRGYAALDDSQIVTQMQKKVKGQVLDATGEPFNRCECECYRADRRYNNRYKWKLFIRCA